MHPKYQPKWFWRLPGLSMAQKLVAAAALRLCADAQTFSTCFTFPSASPLISTLHLHCTPDLINNNAKT